MANPCALSPIPWKNNDILSQTHITLVWDSKVILVTTYTWAWDLFPIKIQSQYQRCTKLTIIQIWSKNIFNKLLSFEKKRCVVPGTKFIDSERHLGPHYHLLRQSYKSFYINNKWHVEIEIYDLVNAHFVHELDYFLIKFNNPRTRRKHNM